MSLLAAAVYSLVYLMVLVGREWHWRIKTQDLTEERDGLGNQVQFWRNRWVDLVRRLDEQDVKK